MRDHYNFFNFFCRNTGQSKFKSS